MVAQTNIFTLPNRIRSNNSGIVSAPTDDNVRAGLQRFDIWLNAHLGDNVFTVGNIAFFQLGSRFEVLDAACTKSVNDYTFVQLCIDARNFRVNAKFLHNLVKDPHGPIQMRCCAGAAGGANQNRHLRLLSSFHNQLEVTFDHRAGCKAFSTSKVIRARIDRSSIEGNHIEAMLERRLYGMFRKTISQHSERGIHCCHLNSSQNSFFCILYYIIAVQIP